MKKCLLLIIFIVLGNKIYSQQYENNKEIVCFAFVFDSKNSDLCINTESFKNQLEIVVDEGKSFKEYGDNFLEYYIKKLLEKYPSAKQRYYSYSIVDEYNDDFKPLTDIPFNTELFLSSSIGVFKAKVYSYYFSCCHDIMPVDFFPLLSLQSEGTILTDLKNDGRLLILTNNPKVSEINYIEEQDLNITSIAYKSMNKYRSKIQVKETNYFKPEEKITIFKGNFTTKNEFQYLVSYLYHTSFDAYSSGVFIMNSNGDILKCVIDFSYNQFMYNLAFGTVDVDGDGIQEIIVENGYYEGEGYELWGFKAGKYVKITNGFFCGV